MFQFCPIKPKPNLISQLESSHWIDPIESAYGICDTDKDFELSMDEIHQWQCLDTLGSMFGFTESGINEAFPQVDTNKDMSVSMKEATMAYEREQAFYRSCERSFECPGDCNQICSSENAGMTKNIKFG